MKVFDPRFYGKLTTSNFSEDDGFMGIDIEASAISTNSYPIEVGWYSKAAKGSVLIKPADIWLSEGHWCKYSEKHCHGISKKLLSKNGLDIDTVALKLNDIFQNNVVVSDIVQFDGIWLTQLFEKASVAPSFTLIGELELRDFRIRVGTHPIKSMDAVIAKRSEKTHRALPDAKWLFDKNS
jgi:DNA polymerase III alpha subunit (gram-positive type)